MGSSCKGVPFVGDLLLSDSSSPLHLASGKSQMPNILALGLVSLGLLWRTTETPVGNIASFYCVAAPVDLVSNSPKVYSGPTKELCPSWPVPSSYRRKRRSVVEKAICGRHEIGCSSASPLAVKGLFRESQLQVGHGPP